MKKTYITPAIKTRKVETSAIICGSNDPTVTSTQAESGSEGLSKGSSFSFGYDSDDDE